jgi:hypothetical protein
MLLKYKIRLFLGLFLLFGIHFSSCESLMIYGGKIYTMLPTGRRMMPFSMKKLYNLIHGSV